MLYQSPRTVRCAVRDSGCRRTAHSRKSAGSDSLALHSDRCGTCRNTPLSHPRSNFLLILDVLLDCRQGRTAHGRNEIAVRPQGRQARSQRRKLRPQHSGSLAFDGFDRTMDAKLRVYLHEQMHMIWHDLHLNDINAQLSASFKNQFFQPDINAIDQNLTAIFWTPNHMIFAGVEHIVVRLIFHANMILHRSIYSMNGV